MTLARCELIQKDSSTLQFSETIDDRIDEWPHSWPKGEISYRLNSFSDDTKKVWQERAVTVALRAIRLREKDLIFRKERNPDTHVDFNVEFEDLAHFNGRRGVFAHAYFVGQDDISGDVHINDDWNWVPGSHLQTLAKPPLVPILIHEFLHSVGLRHDPYDVTDIMYPSFNLGEKKVKIGNRSVARLQERYGKRSLPSWIIAYFQLRRLEGRDFR